MLWLLIHLRQNASGYLMQIRRNHGVIEVMSYFSKNPSCIRILIMEIGYKRHTAQRICEGLMVHLYGGCNNTCDNMGVWSPVSQQQFGKIVQICFADMACYRDSNRSHRRRAAQTHWAMEQMLKQWIIKYWRSTKPVLVILVCARSGASLKTAPCVYQRVIINTWYAISRR